MHRIDWVMLLQSLSRDTVVDLAWKKCGGKGKTEGWADLRDIYWVKSVEGVYELDVGSGEKVGQGGGTKNNVND